jgi:iron complex outermembrane receptor protein
VTPVLSVAADFWNTKLDNVIAFVGAGSIIDRDNGLHPLPIPPGLSITRDPTTGRILQVVEGWTNEGLLEQRGIDASVLFAPTLGRFGSLRHRLIWSRVLTARSNGISFSGGPGFPKNRGQLSSIWRVRMFDAAWSVNLIGRHGTFGTGPYVTHDLQLAWVTPLKALRLVIGAVNVTEKMPTLGPNNGFNGALYDAYGRQAYARLEMKF